MTFPASALRKLHHARQRFGIDGRCLTLGANPQFVDARVLRSIVPAPASEGLLSDRQALRALGFDSVTVLDCAPGPGVDRVSDLNRPDDALAADGPFDFVLDWGACSRVFRLPMLFLNLLAATRVGSAIWHIAPTQNLFGRGHYMLCPTLLYDFYTTNQWEILEFELVHVRSWHDDAWFAAPYVAGAVDFMTFGSAPAGAFLTSALVRRTEASTVDRIPQQSWFLRYTAFAQGLSQTPPAS